MVVKKIGSLQEFKEIISGPKAVVVDFTATWCGPCRVISPIFDRLSETNTNVTFVSVDVDEQAAVAQECGIRAMPTFKVFRGGEQLEETVGANPATLEALITKFNVA